MLCIKILMNSIAFIHVLQKNMNIEEQIISFPIGQRTNQLDLC